MADKPLSEDQLWLIHKTWSGDSSARFWLFSRERGLVQALCRGARTSKQHRAIQVFAPLWAELSQRQGWYYVQKLEMIAPAIQLSPRHLYSALYLNELIVLCLSQQEPFPDLFDCYTATLLSLGSDLSDSALEASLRRFEWCLLVSLGFAISLSTDVRAHRPLEAEAYYQLSHGEGLVAAQSGFLGAHLLKMAVDDLSDPAVLKTAKQLMRQLIDSCLGGKTLKTREMFQALNQR